MYNTDSSTEDKPPAYEEVNDDVGVENVYNEMEYAEAPAIIVKKSLWSKKRIIILVAFLLVLFGGITCAIIFPMGLVLKSGGNNPLADSASSTSTTTSTSTTSTTTSSSATSTCNILALSGLSSIGFFEIRGFGGIGSLETIILDELKMFTTNNLDITNVLMLYSNTLPYSTGSGPSQLTNKIIWNPGVSSTIMKVVSPYASIMYKFPVRFNQTIGKVSIYTRKNYDNGSGNTYFYTNVDVELVFYDTNMNVFARIPFPTTNYTGKTTTTGNGPNVVVDIIQTKWSGIWYYASFNATCASTDFCPPSFMNQTSSSEINIC